MITASSNFRTNLLIEKLGMENIRTSLHALGADRMKMLRGAEDDNKFRNTTARGLGILLEAIAKGTAVDAVSCAEMVAILEKFNEGIPAGLPAGIRVAHKTGEISKIHYDAAIVFAGRPYILVVLGLMTEISRGVYEAIQ
jgi:beta-lactamase class A